jgi:putative ATPase
LKLIHRYYLAAAVFVLKPLTNEEIQEIIIRALKDKERGLGSLSIDLLDDVMENLVVMSGNDARIALNTLETAALVRSLKVMGAGLPGGTSFMEDYTYTWRPGA